MVKCEMQEIKSFCDNKMEMMDKDDPFVVKMRKLVKLKLL